MFRKKFDQESVISNQSVLRGENLELEEVIN